MRPPVAYAGVKGENRQGEIARLFSSFVAWFYRWVTAKTSVATVDCLLGRCRGRSMGQLHG